MAAIATMFGYTDHLGHLSASGTIANLEALWVARHAKPGLVLASSQAHYTHSRMCEVLGLPFKSVAVDSRRSHGLERPRRPLEARAGSPP